MKKTKIPAIIATVLVFTVFALGSGSDSSEKKQITASDAETATTVTDESSSSSADSEDTGTDTKTDETSADENSDKEEKAAKSDVTIEKQVLIDDDGLKITAKEYVTDSIWGDGISLLIENGTSKDIGIGCSALIVNDYMISDLFSASVASGKKANETLNISDSALEKAGISEIGKIEVYFHTYDDDSYSTIKDYPCVEIKTSAYDTMQPPANDDGHELYNDKDVRIVGKYVDENSFWGAGVLLYIENNSGKNIIVQCDDMSINGFMMTPYFSSTVFDGKKCMDEITMLSSELEDNDITSIDEIELKFKILNEKNYKTIVETDPITFSAK